MRSIFTPNAIEFKNDICLIYLYNRRGECIAQAKIDSSDYGRVKNYKWCLSKRKEKPVCVKTTLARGIQLKLHHLFINPKAGFVVDHIDQDILNNRRENLRLATQSQSIHNRIRSSKSGYTGVDWSRNNKKWRAKISQNGKQKLLGYFNSAKEAHEVYKIEAKRLYGDFVNSRFC